MGSICDMANTQRAAAVLEKAPADHEGFPIPELRKYVGRKVTIKDVALSNEHTTCVSAFATLTTEDGEDVMVDLGSVIDLADEGVCGYNLAEYFEPQVLRSMIEAAIADEANGLDADDRDSLREDLELL